MAGINTLDNDSRRCENNSHHGQKKLISLRCEINRLYFWEHLSKNEIARRKRVSKRFVIDWTKSPQQDFTADARGWPLGKRRKWDSQTEERIAQLHAALAADPEAFFHGATAIVQLWLRRHPDDQPPPLRTIGQILRDLGLARPHRKRQPGASRYLLYPEHTIYNVLGERVMEVDFVGHKFIAGRSAPLHFIGYCFKKAPKLRFYHRITAPRSKTLIAGLRKVFKEFERPDCVKIDNAAIMIGTGHGTGNVTRVMTFLLKQKTHPIFAVPRRPFTQASIEGNNSVFGRKFWNRCRFENIADVDRQLAWFNESSLLYTGYQAPAAKRKNKKTFEPTIHFLRQVREDPDSGRTTINVLNEQIDLPASYTNYFVLATWDLVKEIVSVHLERDKTLEQIGSHKLAINAPSRRRLKKDDAFSFCR